MTVEREWFNPEEPPVSLYSKVFEQVVPPRDSRLPYSEQSASEQLLVRRVRRASESRLGDLLITLRCLEDGCVNGLFLRRNQGGRHFLPAHLHLSLYDHARQGAHIRSRAFGHLGNR